MGIRARLHACVSVFSPGLHPRRLPEGLQEEARARDCDAGRRTAAPAPEPSEAARAQPFCRRSLCPRGLRRRRSRGRRLSASGAFAREDSAAAPPRSMQSSTRDVFCLFLADSVLSCRLRGPRMARPTR
ncbi:unnamed protein product [Prorocentrum cordatum]|uniref:Uncharacterized protein n=1 Tax=Prorocentrum cordatum TaxID=2364126 RepID=A0ABN9UD62_9DINO|nr:unnamed protein product [Polarella glacialis]